MATVIAVHNFKGGCGKTTVTINLGAALAARGEAVTLLDLDPQRNLVETVGERDEPFRVRGVSPSTLQDYIPTGPGWCLIDTPPGLHQENRRALVLADAFLIPVTPSLHALKGVAPALSLAAEINPGAKVAGILCAMNDRTIVAREVSEELRRVYGDLVFKVEIPKAAAVEKATVARESVLSWDPESPASEAFKQLAKEVVSRGKK